MSLFSDLLSWFGFGNEAPAPVANAWTLQYSPNMPATFVNQFTFPSADGVHYVVKPAPKLVIGQSMTLKFEIAGTGKFVPTQGDQPARVRLFIQRRGDNLTADEPNKRWWSPPLQLAVGSGQLTVTISPDANWINVNGVPSSAATPGAFRDCIENAANWGFTFGGMFAGHGVFVSGGKMTFLVRQFGVQ